MKKKKKNAQQQLLCIQLFCFLAQKNRNREATQSSKYLNENGSMHQLSDLFPFTVFKCLKIETLPNVFIFYSGVRYLIDTAISSSVCLCWGYLPVNCATQDIQKFTVGRLWSDLNDIPQTSNSREGLGNFSCKQSSRVIPVLSAHLRPQRGFSPPSVFALVCVNSFELPRTLGCFQRAVER